MASNFHALSDQQLARESQDGSLDAFEELVHRYEARVYGFIAQCCGAADAKEITQATFVRAYESIGQFDTEQNFAPWLFTIARRKCVDHFRAAPPWDEREIPEQVDEETPAELLAREEDRNNLWGLARSRLPQAQFEALWLKYAEGMSVCEIATVLRKTQTHVKVLLFRARQLLAADLAKSGASATGRKFSTTEIYERLAYKV